MSLLRCAPPSRTPAALTWRWMFAMVCAAVVALPAWAQTGPHDQLLRLLSDGELGQAQQEAARQLAERPRDPQVRFVQGLIQSRLGQSDEAFATFTELTRDYPELPEPHNNLAVLHAAAGRLEHARAALETALRLNPNYATAHQNLGDVYLQLAAQAYRTGLRLSPDAPALAQRLQRLESLQPSR